MDQNINSRHLTDPNNTFFNDLVTLSGSSLLGMSDQHPNDDHQTSDQSDRVFGQLSCNLTDNHLNDLLCDSSLQLLDDNRMDTCFTPSLQMKTNVSQRNNLFAFHNKKQLFVNNFCLEPKLEQKLEQKLEMKENMEIDDNYVNNTLGLSPLKTIPTKLSPYEGSPNSSFSLPSIEMTESSDVLEGKQFNSFSATEPQLGTDSIFIDQSEDFKSVSKCSDFELRGEPKVDLNNTFRSPNCNFENKSIDTYFRYQSEPINSFQSLNETNTNEEIISKTSKNNFSLINASFASVSGEIDLANNTLEIAQKLIDRKNRKRKSYSLVSTTSSDQLSFTPSINSTVNSNQEETTNRAVVTKDHSSGFGTISAITQQTYAIPDSRHIETFHSMNANSLNLNQLLSISPNLLSLSIGCFVGFKLNYLKVRNLSITSFIAEIKVKTSVDTLNSVDIDYPKEPISIPPLFDGLLYDKIVLTPLKSGSFQIIFQIYPKIENINLPISPMLIVCNIKVEELKIKRPFYTSSSLPIEYNLFDDNKERQTINLLVPNKSITNEIPLRLNLEANTCFSFDPIYRHPDSAIHSFRCSDANTLFVVTKTQYEMRIPIKIEANTQLKSESSLIVSIDSTKSHVLAIIGLKVTFWPKKQMPQPSLQCSESIIKLSDKWRAIHFRNKSKDCLIGVTFQCMKKDSSADHIIKLSTDKLMIKPLSKASIGLLFEQKGLTDKKGLHLLVKYNSGLGNTFTLKIPIEIL